MPHVFVSYVTKDRSRVDRLCKGLESHGIEIWRDRDSIHPGERWEKSIYNAIRDGAFFLACFSKNYEERRNTYMNQELRWAIEELRQIPAKRSWFLPVMLTPCSLPDLAISDDETLGSLQAVRMFEDWDTGLQRLAHAIKTPAHTSFPATGDDLSQIGPEDLKLLDELREEFKDRNRRKFRLLVVGRNGVGKSSTINALLGKKICPIGRKKPTTKEVRVIEAEVNGISFSIVDTPGLANFDSTEESDRRYLKEVKSRIPRIDSLLFVTPLNERTRSDEIRTIRLISEVFSVEVWRRAVVVFTFSDLVNRHFYLSDLHEAGAILRAEIVKYSRLKTAKLIPIVPIANDEITGKPLTTPDRKSWLGELYTQVFMTVSREGAVPFYLASGGRLNFPSQQANRAKRRKRKSQDDSYDIDLSEDQEEKIKKLIRQDPRLTWLERFGLWVDDKVDRVKKWWDSL